MPPAAADKIPCPTPQHLQAEIATLTAIIEPGETEDSWDKMERAIIRFTAVVKGGGYKHHDVFIKAVGNKGIGLKLVDCMMSDRGRLSGAATDLLSSFAPRLGTGFHPLVLLYLPPLVRLLARPNKVYLKRAKSCLSKIITNCPVPSLLPHLRNGLDDKSDECKRSSAEAIEQAVTEWDHARWHERDLELLEVCIRKMATDKDAKVRQTGKKVWALFQDEWPERVEDFTNPLTPTVRRYLDLPPVEGGPSRSRPVARPALGRTGGLAPSHPAHPPASRLNSSTGSDREPRQTRSQLEAGALRSGIPSASDSTVRTHSDRGRSRAMDALPVPGESQQRPLTRSASSRAVSHASSSSNLAAAAGTKSALASKPTRPVLQPPAASESSAPAATSRRFAPPVRPVRSVDVDEEPRRAATRSGSALSYTSTSSAASSSRPTPTLPPSARRVATAPSPAPAPAPASAPASAPATVPPPSNSPPGAAAAPSETRSTSDPTRASNRVRERVSELEKLASELGTPPKHPTPTRELQLAAGIPLPMDTPPAPKPGSNAYSPSLSMLLGKHKMAPDADFTLADLTVDVNNPDSPLVQRVSGLPPSAVTSSGVTVPSVLPGSSSSTPSSLAGLPTPGLARSASITELIHKFSPNTTTPLRSVQQPQDAQTPTPAAPMPLPAETERRISPLPRRTATADSPASTPRSSKKRKGSDLEQSVPAAVTPAPVKSLIDATPFTVLPVAGAAPAAFVDPTPIRSKAEQPLISFFDSPASTPFKFGAGAPSGPVRPRNSIFSALMGLAMDTPQASTVEPQIAESDEGDEGDVTVRIDATEITTTPAQMDVELEDEADATAILVKADVEEVQEEVQVPEQPAPVFEQAQLVQTAIVAEPEPVEDPVEELVDEPTPTPAEPEPQVESPPTASPLPEQAAAPPTPHHKILAEFDTLTEPEDNEEGDEATDEVVPEPATEVVAATEPAQPEATKEASPEPLVDTSDPIIVPAVEKTSPLQEMKEVFEEPPTVDLMKISTGSKSSNPSRPSSRVGSRTFRSTTPADSASTETKPKSRPVSAAERRPKSTLATRRREPVEKKSFRPVSRINDAKAAPAPARLATRSGVTAPTASSMTRAAAATTVAAASTSTTASSSASAPPRAARKPAAPQIISAPKPAPPVGAKAPTMPKTTGSNLFKPTAATAARAAATAAATTAMVEAKEKENKDVLDKEKEATKAPKPLSRPASALGTAPAPAAKISRPTGSAFGSTAASRAREAALPPSKRQRIKLTAPQESFRPGRTNKSKTAVLGAAAAGPSTRRRAVRGRPVDETFPLPGPGLRTALGKDSEAGKGSEAGKEQPGRESAAKASGKGSEPVAVPRSTLDVPSELDLVEPLPLPRTPSTLYAPTPNSCRSPASSRHTSHSDLSLGSRPSPSKLKPSPARPLDPVLTPTHSANVSALTSQGQVLVAPVADSPAVVHARRVSGIPASLKKTITEEAAKRKAMGITSPLGTVSSQSNISGSPPSTGSRNMLVGLGISEDVETPRRHRRSTRGHLKDLVETMAEESKEEAGEEDTPASVIRHDVSTPTGKAASLLSKLNDERRALTPRDANAE